MSFPRYAAYRDSGLNWIGRVPVHWNEPVTLGSISSLKGRLGWQGLKAEEYRDEGPYVVSSAHFSNFKIRWDECPRVSEERYEADNNIQLSEQDILLMKDGAAMGKLSFVEKLPGKACLNSHLLLFRPLYRNGRTPTYSPKFAFYYMQTAFFQEYIKVNGTGATFLGISQDAISRYRVCWPDFEEQDHIAVFLDRETAKIDALIAEQGKLIALLAEKRQATISRAVTKGLSPNAPMKDSGVAWLGEVPTHWVVTRLKFVASVQTGIAKGKDTTGKQTITVPYLRVANVQDGFLALNDIATIDIEVEQLDRYRLRPGDVLMNEGGDFDKLGRGAIWSGEIAGCIHQNHVFAVRPHGVSAEWLNRITSSHYAQFYFMGRSKQSTNLASISSTNIMELPVLLPSQSEQQAILEFIGSELKRLDTLKAQSQQAIILLRERRSAIIAAAVTGQIDVRGTVSHVLAESPEAFAA